MKKTEMFSSAEDCYLLAIYLKQALKDRISYFGSIDQEVISGKYFSPYKRRYNTNFFLDNGLPFCYKYLQDGFLRIQIGSGIPTKTSMGEKLAALSSFYEVLEKIFGVPTAFYTLEDDDEETISLQWSFQNKEEDIAKMKDNDYFDDAKIDQLIIFNQDEKSPHYKLSQKTKEDISKKIGLPWEMSTLVDENVVDYTRYKNNSEFSSQSNIVPFQKRKKNSKYITNSKI